MSDSATIKALRQALEISPDNLPLRLHLAETLRHEGRQDAAMAEYKEAVKRAPESAAAKLGLVGGYLAEGSHKIGLVILEDVLAAPEPPAEAHLLHAKLLVAMGEVEEAVAALQAAIEQDPSLADDPLVSKLGIGADPTESPVIDGRVLDGSGLPPPDVDDEAEVDEAVADLIERPQIDFEQVGGMDAVKDEIQMKIIYPLQHKDMYAAYGKKIGGGILLYGPPGCGKTHLARATAGQVQAHFISVGLHDVLDMYIGQSERRLHGLFESGRQHQPCVLFFDEVDALAASRTDMRQQGSRKLINQFLSELDGMDADNEGLLILAATNAPWHLDTAFRRPGRFDRIIFVPPPDEPARAAILEILLRDKPTDKVDTSKVARKTEHCSGADLKALVDMTVEDKLREAMASGKPSPITTKDLLKAAKRLKPSTKEWFVTARNYALYANEGGLYDDILDYLKLKR